MGFSMRRMDAIALGAGLLVGALLFTAAAQSFGQIGHSYPRTDTREGPVSLGSPRAESAAQRHIRPPVDVREAWQAPPPMDALRGSTICTFDNGPPLDDGGHPASQISDAADINWKFIGGAADDFILPVGTPGMNCKITSIRAGFYFAGPNAGSATPATTWLGVYVYVYPDAMGAPGGQPAPGDYNGGQTGMVVASRFVPSSSLQNETPVNTCTPSFVIDIPVEITVERGVRYWLSIVPKFVAPPQSFWCLSQTAGTDLIARHGFEYPGSMTLFWTMIPGNSADGACTNPPPNSSRKNLAFLLTGVEVPAETGACCTDSGPMQGCVAGVASLACQGANQRFLAGAADCNSLNPLCGMGGVGACCLPDGVCQNLDAATCQNSSGVWNAGTCASVSCPPVNGRCDHAIMISDGVFPFDTSNAITDGPATPMAPCTPVNQDVWYQYMATCTGALTVSLCGSGFDTAVAIYQGSTCPPPQGPGLGSQLGCNDDFCGTGSRMTINVTSGQTYKIRVGGKGAASGAGVMSVGCVPSGLGACCLPISGCITINQAECAAMSGTFSLGRPCVGDSCPTPANDNCVAAIAVTAGGAYSFDTRGATTDGPSTSGGCPMPNQDIWFSYTAQCTGTLKVSLCDGTLFDSVVAVYAGCACPPAGAEIACANDGCGSPNGPSTVDVSVMSGQCYLIRVGGVGAAAGQGRLELQCLPAGIGACCRTDQVCYQVIQSNCTGADEVFSPGLLCWQVTCNPPQPVCCMGDINGDGLVDMSDVDGFTTVLLGALPGGGSVLCRLDMNEDGAFDGLDLQGLVDAYLRNKYCCCAGDTSHDGILDGRDISGYVQLWVAGNQPSVGTSDFCLLNVNHDQSITQEDLDMFVASLLTPTTCPPLP